MAASATDALFWQLLASVFWPGSVIHLVVAVASKTLEVLPGADAAAAAVAEALPVDAAGAAVLASVPTALGLVTIPFIVEPIDETVEKVSDVSVRPALNAFTRALATADPETHEGEGGEEKLSPVTGPAGILGVARVSAGAPARPPARFAVADLAAHASL